MVAVRSLVVELGGRRVLNGVDLDVAPGQWTTVIGPNGAGKTTLLRAVAGLTPRASGTVSVGGRNLDDLKIRERAQAMAVMPQSPVIPPRMRVLDYVLLGRTSHLGRGLQPGAADVDVVAETMDAVDLHGFGDRRVDQLSGGERQRVMIARAIAQQAPLLLLDEPTTALDVGHQLDVLELVDRLRVDQGLTVLATFHDLGLAAQYSAHLVLLVDGAVAACGPPDEVLDPELLSRVYRADLDIVRNNGDIAVIARRRRTS